MTSVLKPSCLRLTWDQYSQRMVKRENNFTGATTEMFQSYNEDCSFNKQSRYFKYSREKKYLSNRNLTTWRLKFSGTVLLNQRLKPTKRPMAVNILRRLVWNKTENMATLDGQYEPLRSLYLTDHGAFRAVVTKQQNAHGRILWRHVGVTIFGVLTRVGADVWLACRSRKLLKNFSETFSTKRTCFLYGFVIFFFALPKLERCFLITTLPSVINLST